MPEGKDSRFANNLIAEKSPYLLQHAYNPVAWYPWGEEAFEKAEREDKPVFLSIGYSSCHWCHVMEQEVFSDPGLGALMNETFVSIKVDREERPEVDAYFMSAAQILTGSAGWPLNLLLFPDKKPFYAATYIPGKSRAGMIGMEELVAAVREVWSTRREEAARIAMSVTDALASAGGVESEDRAFDPSSALSALKTIYDPLYAGFGTGRKFPVPHYIMLLFQMYRTGGDKEALGMATATLKAMRLGGLFDHVGFGFHRYAVDRSWSVPHFEKMLYDQALLALAFLDGYALTGEKLFYRTADEVLGFMLSDMLSEEGGFYSALDADSEEGEGFYYLFKAEEIRSVLSEESSYVFERFNVTETGNEASHIAHGMNHLSLSTEPSSSELDGEWEPLRKQLLAYRNSRPEPATDHKILTDWNGLAIAALARASMVLGNDKYLESALRAARFIAGQRMGEGFTLSHVSYDNGRTIDGGLDDYAFTVFGLLELFKASLKPEILGLACGLAGRMLEYFKDCEAPGLFSNRPGVAALPGRVKQLTDGAIPSGNSVALNVLVSLCRITDSSRFCEEASGMALDAGAYAGISPSDHAFLCYTLAMENSPFARVCVCAKEKSASARSALARLYKLNIPNLFLVFKGDGDEGREIEELVPFTKDITPRDGPPLFYACVGSACLAPTSDMDAVIEYIKKHCLQR